MFKSLGIKRLIAAILLPVVEVLRAIPGTGEAIVAVEALAATVGVVGLAHAAKAKTVTKKRMVSAAALLAVLIEVAQFVPSLQPYIPLLQQIAAILGATAVGSALPKKK